MAGVTGLALNELEMPDKFDGLRLLLTPIIKPPDGKVTIGSDDTHKTTLPQSDPKANEIIGLVQRKQDVQVNLEISRPPEPTFRCSLYYRPNSDNVIFANRSTVTAEIASVHGNKPIIRITPGKNIEFGHGLWRLDLWSLPMLEWTTLPRQLAAIKKLELDHGEKIDLSKADQSLKRRVTMDNKEGGLVTAGPSVSNDATHASGTRRKEPVSGMIRLQEGETLYLPSVDGEDAYQITMQKKVAINDASELFRAWHSSYGECIIVKVLQTPENKDARWIKSQSETWLREYTIQSKMDHESVVKLKGWDARYLSLYLEYVPSYDLSSSPHWRDSNHHFIGTQRDTERVVRDTARALEHIHAKGFKHKDIKPGNILYSPERGAVVCDFGVSEPIGRNQIQYSGTPWYIPPELVRGYLVDTPADIWALGIVMLYLLGFTPLPERDTRAEAWMISDLASNDKEPRLRATKRQNYWMKLVRSTRDKLSSEDRLHTLVGEMLDDEPKTRISAKKLAKAFENMSPNPNTTHDDIMKASSADSSSTDRLTDSTDLLSDWVYGDATSAHDQGRSL